MQYPKYTGTGHIYIQYFLFPIYNIENTAFTTEVRINYKAVLASVEQYYFHFTDNINNKAEGVHYLLKVNHIPGRNRKPAECCCV